MAKTRHPVTNLRLVRKSPGRIDGGEYVKPTYGLLFDRNGLPCIRPVANNGERRPLGQDCINAMRQYINAKETTEAAVLDARIVE